MDMQISEADEAARENDPNCNYKTILPGDKVFYVEQDTFICAEIIAMDLSKGVVEVREMPAGNKAYQSYDRVHKTLDDAFEAEVESYKEWLETRAEACVQEFSEVDHVEQP